MLLGLMTGLHDRINVRDFGLNNITAADGLAVPSPSGFVGKSLEGTISGVYTVKDAHLYDLLRLTADTENIYLEPSALAGIPVPLIYGIQPRVKRTSNNRALCSICPMPSILPGQPAAAWFRPMLWMPIMPKGNPDQWYVFFQDQYNPEKTYNQVLLLP